MQGETVALRFYGYFLEPCDWQPGALGMPDQKEMQVRKVVVLFFPEDETLAVHEQRAPNSGIAGGVFFKRSPAYNDEPPARLITVTDLQVGGVLRLVGREFVLIDCDPATRAYYENELQLPQAPATLSYPTETPEEYRAEHATGMGKPRHLSSRAGSGPQPSSEIFRKSNTFKNQKEQMEKEQRFFAHAGQVLKFDLFWDDRGAWAGQRNVYVMHYYLADDAVEIRTRPQPGFDKFPCLLKRSKLPKNWEAARRGSKPEYFNFRELRTGETVNVFGREMLIIDCDAFTKDFYRYNFGYEQRAVDVSEPPPPKIEHPVPKLGEEFLAIGSEEDTLQSVFGQPKVRRDFDRAFKNHNKVLRCKCSLVSDEVTDKNRRFVLTYYLEDDTFQVFEDRVANSGIVGGVFLRRGRYKYPIPMAGGEKRYFEPSDFFWGAALPLSTKYVMLIKDFDVNSLKIMEQYKDYFPHADIDSVLHKIMNTLATTGVNLRLAFHRADPRGTGCVASKQAFLQVFEQNEVLERAGLSEHEKITLLRKFVPDGPAESPIGYVHMCDMLAFMYSCNLEKDVTAAAGGSDERIVKRRRRASLTSATPEEFVMLLSIIEVPWRKVFKKFDPEGDGTLTLAQLESSLLRNHIQFGRAQVQYIREKFSAGHLSKNELNLHALCDAIYDTDFTSRQNSLLVPAMQQNAMLG